MIDMAMILDTMQYGMIENSWMFFSVPTKRLGRIFHGYGMDLWCGCREEEVEVGMVLKKGYGIIGGGHVSAMLEDRCYTDLKWLGGWTCDRSHVRGRRPKLTLKSFGHGYGRRGGDFSGFVRKFT